ncbi:MAG: zinc-ribbon domain-containing protein [Dehalococcoidia bacterium]|nr:zinc-ribbon domain-containing protein [Dehalococcoidia bacterium]
MRCSKCGTENPEEAKFCSKCGADMGGAATPGGGAAKPEAESSTGMSANVAGLLCYVVGWITGIVFVLLEKKSTFVKFHAWQSIMTFGVLMVAQIVFSGIIVAIGIRTLSPGLVIFAGVISWIIWVVTVILWIVLMIMAGTGRMWKVPGAGNWAEKQANR